MTTPSQTRALAENIITKLDATMGQGPAIVDTQDMYAVARAVLGLTAELARLRANQRTAGTVEVCALCKGPFELGKLAGVIHDCPGVCTYKGEPSNCPIRAAKDAP